MPQQSDTSPKRLLVLEQKDLWVSFLKTCFADVPVQIDHCAQPSHASGVFDQVKPAVVFCEAPFLTLPFLQKLKVRKETDPLFRLYLLGEPGPVKKDVRFDEAFPVVPSAQEFFRRFFRDASGARDSAAPCGRR
jgi:hypothetical protein